MLFKKVFSLCSANSLELQIEIAGASNFQIKSLTRLFTLCQTSTLPVTPCPSTRPSEFSKCSRRDDFLKPFFICFVPPDRALFDELILRYETTFLFPVRFRKIKRFLFSNSLVPSKLAPVNRDLNESHGESITSTPFDEGGSFREGRCNEQGSGSPWWWMDFNIL